MRGVANLNEETAARDVIAGVAVCWRRGGIAVPSG
jgi:hypothetical protein